MLTRSARGGMQIRMLLLLWGCMLTLFCSSLVVRAETIIVEPGDPIQDAINIAQDGDDIELGVGTYFGDINFLGKAITIRGQGRDTIIDGSGDEATVMFVNGEGRDSVLEKVNLIGGFRRGAVFVFNSGPTIRQNIIRNNLSVDLASALRIFGGNDSGEFALVHNNIITRNEGVDRRDKNIYAVLIEDASVEFFNNTISNNTNSAVGIIGDSQPTLWNNIIAFNGTRGAGIGWGLSLLGKTAPDDSIVEYNLFHKNVLGAMLVRDDKFRKISKAESSIERDTVSDNLDGNPRFRSRKKNDFRLRRKSPAINNGNPNGEFNDADDGSRNDLGASGGSTPIPVLE